MIIPQLGYADFELYGQGFAGEAFLRTRALDLGRRVILGEVRVHTTELRRSRGRWLESGGGDGEGQRTWIPGELVETPGVDASAVVRVKTGTTDDSRRHFGYTDFGELDSLSSDEWVQLDDSALITCHGKCHGQNQIVREEPGWRGPVVPDTENWTSWSRPIDNHGARPALENGRYLQLRVNMASRRPTDVVRLDSVTVEILPVLVPALVGEVALKGNDGTPLAQVPLGEPAELVFAMRAGFDGPRAAGFDAIRLSTPSQPDFVRLERGEPLVPVEVGASDLEVDDDGLTIHLADPVTRTEALRVRLRTTLYTVSDLLLVQVFSDGEAAVRQIVADGNATDDIATDRLQIVAKTNVSRIVADLQVQPQSITPNGDRRNDEMTVSYTLFGVWGAEVELGVYPLGGALVHRTAVPEQRAGVNEPLTWNGRAGDGRLVHPGLYLCQVFAASGQGRSTLIVPVSVV